MIFNIQFNTNTKEDDIMNIKTRRFQNGPFNMELNVTQLDGKLYFFGTEVASKLGYKDPRAAIRDLLTDKHKLSVGIENLTVCEIVPEDGRGVLPHPFSEPIVGVIEKFISHKTINSQRTLITEAGLYKLIFSSKLPDARQFEDWVTEEVLPSIREHGVYVQPGRHNNADELLQNTISSLKEDKSGLLEQLKNTQNELAYFREKSIEYENDAMCLDAEIDLIDARYGNRIRAAEDLIKILLVKLVEYHCRLNDIPMPNDKYKIIKLAIHLLHKELPDQEISISSYML